MRSLAQGEIISLFVDQRLESVSAIQYLKPNQDSFHLESVIVWRMAIMLLVDLRISLIKMNAILILVMVLASVRGKLMFVRSS